MATKYDRTMILLTASAILAICTLVLSIAGPALALKMYFNCTTAKANKNGILTLEDVNNCYYKVFVGARKYYANESQSATPTG
jgi:hypothetical protein